LTGDRATTGASAVSAEGKPASREAQHTPDAGGESAGVSRAVAALRAELDASLRGGRWTEGPRSHD
jgi:hypothetical protein